MFIGTIDFYRFIKLSLTLTLVGHKASADQHLLSSFVPHTFELIEMMFDTVLKQFKLNILIRRLSEIYRNKGNNCYFTGCVNAHKRWHAFRHFRICLAQTWCDDRYY